MKHTPSPIGVLHIGDLRRRDHRTYCGHIIRPNWLLTDDRCLVTCTNCIRSLINDEQAA